MGQRNTFRPVHPFHKGDTTKTETLLDILATLQGDALEQAYGVIKAKIIEKHARDRARRVGERSCFLVLITNRASGSRFTAVNGRIMDSNTPLLAAGLRPSDSVLKAVKLESWPTVDEIRGLVSDIFTRLNPDWKGVPQWIDHEDGSEFTMKAV